ncbi:homolog of xeroderma pigmentosum complementationgroup B 1 [Striga asiatica]|uniref:Homolog of xeroderma pigmentosum complementationgroup B 1 n=1 Tax=Striga asiatica TaxID=4170 RepID=A0A5A7R517_STRAF|nr:homolog of xeroderma pigmentosum complementationgroup B 1 [Striga asiatica]
MQDSRGYQIAVEAEVDGRYKPRRQLSGGAAAGVREEHNKSRAPPDSAWWSDERRRWIVGDVIADMADLVGVDQLEAVVVVTGPTAAVWYRRSEPNSMQMVLSGGGVCLTGGGRRAAGADVRRQLKWWCPM